MSATATVTVTAEAHGYSLRAWTQVCLRSDPGLLTHEQRLHFRSVPLRTFARCHRK